MLPIHVVLAVAISLIWGVNFVAAKICVAYFPAFFLLAIRLSIVAIVLSPFMRKRQLPLKDLFKISVVLSVFHFGLMFLALQHGLDSSVAVVIDQLRVPFAATLGYFMFGEVVEKKGIFGIATAILGTFVIVGTPNVIQNYHSFWMLIACSAAWAYYNTQVKKLGQLDVLPFIGWISFFGAPQLFLISFLLEGNQLSLIPNTPHVVTFSLIYMSVITTIAAHGGWYFLLKKYPINRVVPYSLLVPVFGMIAGVMFLNEVITWQIIVGGVLTVVGVAIIVIKKPLAAESGDTV